VDGEIAQLGRATAEIRRRIADRDEGVTDVAERTATIAQIEEQANLLGVVTARRDQIRGGFQFGPVTAGVDLIPTLCRAHTDFCALRASASADVVTVTMTVPAGIPAGQHQFTAVVGDPSGQLVTITGFRVDVVGASGHQSAGSTTGAAPTTGESSSAPSSPSAPVAGHHRGGGSNPVETWLLVGGAVLAAAAGAAAIVRYQSSVRPPR
jgi:hypothetical protein